MPHHNDVTADSKTSRQRRLNPTIYLGAMTKLTPSQCFGDYNTTIDIVADCKLQKSKKYGL